MNLFKNITIKQKLLILTVAGVIVGVGVFSFLGMKAVNESTEAMLQDRMTTTQLVAGYLDEVLATALVQMDHTTHIISQDGGDENIQGAILELEETFSRLSISVSYIYLLNQSGEAVWTKPENPQLEMKNLTYYPTVSKVLVNGESDISGLVSSPITDTPVIFLLSPVINDGQDTEGLLIMAIDPVKSNIGGFVKPIRLGDTGYVEIVDQNGIVVARTDPGPKLAPFEKSDHSSRFAELIVAGEPTRGLCHTCHEPIQQVQSRDILAFVPLTEANWGVVIRQSEEEALAPINELSRNLILYGVVLGAIALTFILIITRDIINRIGLLISASRTIAQGDLKHVINVSKKDEIGILAENLEDMRVRLRSSYEDLGRRTDELSSLLSVSEILSHLPDLSDLDTALHNALKKTLEIMGEKHGSICLLDEEGKTLSCHAHISLYEEHISQVSYPLGHGISGKVAENGQAIIVEDIRSDKTLFHPSLHAKNDLRGFASVPLRSKGKVLGVMNIASLEVRKFIPEDMRLLEGIARIIAAAVENASLHHEVQDKEIIRGELLNDIFLIQEEERKRIARELHDETSQVLSSLDASLEAAVCRLPAGTDSNVKPILRKAQNLSITMLDEIRKLIYELRPSLLDDMGLVAATRWLLQNNLEAAGIKTELKTTGKSFRLPPQIETTLFRVIQEAVNNILKHAGAATVKLQLDFKKTVIGVNIRDDGSGFNLNDVLSSKQKPRGLGLLGMKERIGLVKGTFKIHSTINVGTEIEIEIPIVEEVPNAR